MVEVISAETFQKEIFDFKEHEVWLYEKETPIVLNFFASWCGPCQLFAPSLEKVASDYQGKLKVFKVDIDASPEIPALFGIRSVPTTLFIAQNEDPALSMGAMPIENLKKAIKDLLQVD